MCLTCISKFLFITIVCITVDVFVAAIFIDQKSARHQRFVVKKVDTMECATVECNTFTTTYHILIELDSEMRFE